MFILECSDLVLRRDARTYVQILNAENPATQTNEIQGHKVL